MKKLTALILTLAMSLCLLTGCGGSGSNSGSGSSSGSDSSSSNSADSASNSGEAPHFEIIVKSYQSSYWQAAVTGVNQAAEDLGVKVKCTGPNAESDIADQVNMINSAINSNPAGIGLAACDQNACLDALQTALDKGIPVVCFDSGIPDAPAGSVYSTIATDNYGAGATAAENLYAALKDKIASASAPVRIGEVNPDATSESITSRGLGFIDKFAELASAYGKSVAVIGNDYFTNNCQDAGDESSADVIIEVAVPAQTTADMCATEASVILNKSDTIGIFASNQIATEGVLTSNENLGVLGTDPNSSILAAGFDAGSVIKGAIQSGTLYGAVTQSPLAMGITTVEVLNKIANGESVQDVLTDGYWYNIDNMDDPSIAPNLYD